MADVGEEETLGDGDVCGVLVGGGVGGALVRIPLAAYVGVATLLLVVFLLLLSSPFLSSPLSLSLDNEHLEMK